MNTALKVVCAVIILVGNLAVITFLTFFAWLSSNWMTGKWAWNWTSRDWAFEACWRALYWLAIAAFVGLVAAIINRFIFAFLFPEENRLPWLVASAPGYFIALGGIIGSVMFFIEKPYM
jgi:hypothetical protein